MSSWLLFLPHTAAHRIELKARRRIHRVGRHVIAGCAQVLPERLHCFFRAKITEAKDATGASWDFCHSLSKSDQIYDQMTSNLCLQYLKMVRWLERSTETERKSTLESKIFRNYTTSEFVASRAASPGVRSSLSSFRPCHPPQPSASVTSTFWRNWKLCRPCASATRFTMSTQRNEYINILSSYWTKEASSNYDQQPLISCLLSCRWVQANLLYPWSHCNTRHISLPQRMSPRCTQHRKARFFWSLFEQKNL